MSRIIETEVFKFNELPENIQEKVIENLWDINIDYEWWNCIYEDAEEIGFKIEEFDLDRKAFCNGKFIYNLETIAENIIKNHGETCQTYIEALYFILKITPLQEKLEKIENILYNFSHLPYKNKWIVKLSNIEKELTNNIEELETDFKNNIKNEYFKILQKEYEYLTSKEAITETIEANEYEFTIDGKIK